MRRKTPRVRLNAEHVEQVFALVRTGVTRKAVAGQLGINPSTLADWIRQGEENPAGLKGRLVEAIESAEAQVSSDNMQTILRAAERGDWRAAAFYETKIRKLKQDAELHKLEVEKRRLEIQAHRENLKRLQAETEHRQLINQALRFQEQRSEGTEFTRESLEIQATEVTEEAMLKYYAVPSMQEDEQAIRVEQAAPIEEVNTHIDLIDPTNRIADAEPPSPPFNPTE